MIYSGSGSEFSEFRVRIQAKVPGPCGSGSNPCYLSVFRNFKQNSLKFNHKEDSTGINYLPSSISYYSPIVHLKFNNKEESTGINYLPFSISYYSPTVHEVQNSKRNNIFIYLLFCVLLDPDPEQ